MRDPDDENPFEHNPFERWGIDPAQGPNAITERMRTLAQEAPDEETRRAIRAAWEELTKHPVGRFRAATGAHPDSYGGALDPPPRPAPHPRAPSEIRRADLAMRPSILEALGLEEAARSELPDVSLEEDLILGS